MLPAKGNIGNAGLGQLVGQGLKNWDATMTVTIPLGSEKRVIKVAAQAYNAFNHTQFSTWGTSAAFNAAGANTTASFGFPTAARPAGILAFSARVEF